MCQPDPEVSDTITNRPVGGENSISHEVVDSGEFVLNLIGRVCIYLSVLALPVVLVSGQTRTSITLLRVY